MTIAIVVLPLALVLSLAAAGHWLASAQVPPPPACGNEEMQEQIRSGMFQGLDEAFRQKVASIYTVWLSDNRQQPARAKAGVDQAVGAYTHAYKAVETWRLPPCR